MGPWAGLDDFEKRKIFFPKQESNIDSSALHPVTQSLYQLTYPGCFNDTDGMTTVLAHLENLYTITSCNEVSEDLLLPTSGQTRLGGNASHKMSFFTGISRKIRTSQVQPDSTYFTVRQQRTAAGDRYSCLVERAGARTENNNTSRNYWFHVEG